MQKNSNHKKKSKQEISRSLKQFYKVIREEFPEYYEHWRKNTGRPKKIKKNE